MKQVSILALAAALAVGTALPAHAEWDRLGTVDISGRERSTTYGAFGGPVERLSLSADRGDVYCRSVNVTFGNGSRRTVFSGTLREDRPQAIDLPGAQRKIKRIDFNCKSTQRLSAQIKISADIGQYRDTWRRHPDYQRNWASVFKWDDNDRRRPPVVDRDHRNDGWTRLGSEVFTGRERESTFTGMRGSDLNAIGLEAVDDDARCSSIRVHYASGGAQNLQVGNRLDAGRIVRFDLPGKRRDVRQVDLVCQAIGDRDVTVNIYGVK